MSRYSDHTGVNHTCPKINEVISAIHSADWSESSWDVKEVIDIMEEIRSANSELRDFGNNMCKERDELQDNLDSLEREKLSLESDIESYKKEIKTLEGDVASLLATIDELEKKLSEK